MKNEEKPRAEGPRHFLGTDEWEDSEILEILENAKRLKNGLPVEGKGDLKGKILGLVFFNPSLRTRTSMEAAAMKNGGTAIVLEPGKGAWKIETREGVIMDKDSPEHMKEAAGVLGRYFDAIGVRAFPAGKNLEEAFSDPVVRGFARHAGVPVINLESARRHPCQGLADSLTLQEKLDGNTKGRKFALTWTWHPNPLPTAVPVSAAICAARLGMHVTIARPKGFDLHPEDMACINSVAERNGAMVEVVDSMEEALGGADAVYAKSWGSLEFFGDIERERASRKGLKHWMVGGESMKTTRNGKAIFMHCLPIRRGVVATDEVLDGPWSVVIDQAENRLHVQRALLLEVMQ